MTNLPHVGPSRARPTGRIARRIARRELVRPPAGHHLELVLVVLVEAVGPAFVALALALVLLLDEPRALARLRPRPALGPPRVVLRPRVAVHVVQVVGVFVLRCVAGGWAGAGAGAVGIRICGAVLAVGRGGGEGGALTEGGVVGIARLEPAVFGRAGVGIGARGSSRFRGGAERAEPGSLHDRCRGLLLLRRGLL